MNTSTSLFKKSLPWIISVIMLAALAASPAYAPSYTVILLTAILMYTIMTVSWTIFSGPTGYISLATASFFGIGIYTSAILGKLMPLPAVILTGAAVSFVVALIVGAVTLRLRGIYFTIFTFGLVELIKQVLLWYEVNITGTRGRFVIVIDNTTIFFYIFIIFVALLLTAYFIKRSKYGLALRSIGDYEEASAHIGVNVTWVKIFIFAVTAVFIGATGSIMATRWTYIDPYIAFNYNISFTVVLMAIFGGMGKLYGPIIGAVVFAYLEEILITQFPYFYMLLFGLVLVIAILFLPNGIVALFPKIRNLFPGRKNANP
jgi:branched-chain amino acid transport system permease protein